MITFDRFQGDPAVNITEEGADMAFRGGQPVMDNGLHNAVLISLFTKPGWWGNDLVTEESKKIGSKFQRQRTIVNIDTLTEMIDDAEKALERMKGGLASKIDIEITNPYMNQLYGNIILYLPGKDSEEFQFIYNGLAWIGQALNPASERL